MLHGDSNRTENRIVASLPENRTFLESLKKTMSPPFWHAQLAYIFLTTRDGPFCCRNLITFEFCPTLFGPIILEGFPKKW